LFLLPVLEKKGQLNTYSWAASVHDRTYGGARKEEEKSEREGTRARKKATYGPGTSGFSITGKRQKEKGNWKIDLAKREERRARHSRREKYMAAEQETLHNIEGA